MTRAFSISLNTNLVFPQPVGPATSAVNGCRRDRVMSTKQATSLTTKSQERANDRAQCGKQQGGDQEDQVVRLFSVAILYAARMRTVTRRIHRSTADSSLPTALFIVDSLPSLPSPPTRDWGFRGKGAAGTSCRTARAARALCLNATVQRSTKLHLRCVLCVS